MMSFDNRIWWRLLFFVIVINRELIADGSYYL